MLRLLNRAFGMPLCDKKLAEAALSLGADVPFCLKGGTALAKGVGEKLQPLAPMPACFFVVAKPGFSVATKDAFQLYDQQPARNYPASTALMEGLERGELETVARNLYNALEEPVGGQKPLIFRVRDTLLEQGALGARMTGSGSAVFGIFTQEAQARQAAGQLRKLCRDVFVCRPLARKK